MGTSFIRGVRTFGVLCRAVVLAGNLVVSAALADNNWVPSSGLWNDPANWSQGHVPDTTAEIVAIINGGTAEYNSSMGSTSFGPTSGNNEFRIGRGPTGNTTNTLNITGGTLQKNNGEVIAGYGIGQPTTGIINVSGGNFVLDTAGINPILTLGWLGATGYLNISNGGSVTAVQLRCGTGPNGTGYTTIDATGGTMTMTELVVGHDGGTGLFTQNGGTVNATSFLDIGNTTVASGSGQYVLNGGTLVARRVISSGTTGTFKFNGGTLQATQDEFFFIASPTLDVLVQSGGAIIDTQSFFVLVNNPLLEDSSSTGGGLTKLGDGILTLDAVGSTYAGDTKVLAGSLSISDTYLNDSSNVFLTTGATLDLNFSGTDTIDGLLIDNVAQATGTWGAIGSGAMHESGLLTGSGFLNVGAAGGVPGDYNDNGIVDAADYVVWRKSVGTTNTLPNDPLGGTIGSQQYDQWRAHFGQSAGSGSLSNSTVPESASLVLLLLAVAGMSIYRRPSRPLAAVV